MFPNWTYCTLPTVHWGTVPHSGKVGWADQILLVTSTMGPEERDARTLNTVLIVVLYLIQTEINKCFHQIIISRYYVCSTR